MKRLYLLRHSKAGQTNKKLLDDHERHLTEKGVELATLIGNHIADLDPAPEIVISSPAIRTMETTEHALKQANMTIPVEAVSKLYLADPATMLSAIHDLDNAVSTVLLVGHNPGMQQFAMLLAGNGDKKKFRKMRNNFPAPAIATFNIHSDNWLDVKMRGGELIDFVTAKELDKIDA